jgi:hypothetical protein
VGVALGKCPQCQGPGLIPGYSPCLRAPVSEPWGPGPPGTPALTVGGLC